METPGPVETCPACEGEVGVSGEPVPYRRIWAALEDEFSIVIPTDVRDAYTRGDAALAACRECGLQFFVHAIPGGPDFYSLLDGGPGYYSSLTWEGRVVSDLISTSEAVVDFGCGDGALLKHMCPRSGRTVGVDHYAEAIASFEKVGIEGHTVSFAEFAEYSRGEFDVALAMQVLEHLPDASGLMLAAHRVLRGAGRFFIAVPNADRVPERFEPQDWPPHHVSRWTVGDLDRLAQRYGFRVAQVHTQPGAQGALRRSLGGLPGRVVGKVLPEQVAQRIVRRFAPQLNTYGHTLLAELAPAPGS